MEILIYILDLFGVAVFAVTGSLAAGRKQMDLFGVVVLATVTALGGGTIRDLVLGKTPVFWVSSSYYLLVSVVTSVVTFYGFRFFRPPVSFLSVADALGLAVFTVIGTQTAIDLQVSWEIAVVMGVMTGVFGGMIRDVLSGEIPLILRQEIYATASLCGATLYIAVLVNTGMEKAAVVLAIGLTLCLRLSAIKWNISLPVFVPEKK